MLTNAASGHCTGDRSCDDAVMYNLVSLMQFQWKSQCKNAANHRTKTRMGGGGGEWTDQDITSESHRITKGSWRITKGPRCVEATGKLIQTNPDESTRIHANPRIRPGRIQTKSNARRARWMATDNPSRLTKLGTPNLGYVELSQMVDKPQKLEAPIF